MIRNKLILLIKILHLSAIPRLLSSNRIENNNYYKTQVNSEDNTNFSKYDSKSYNRELFETMDILNESNQSIDKYTIDIGIEETNSNLQVINSPYFVTSYDRYGVTSSIINNILQLFTNDFVNTSTILRKSEFTNSSFESTSTLYTINEISASASFIMIKSGLFLLYYSRAISTNKYCLYSKFISLIDSTDSDPSDQFEESTIYDSYNNLLISQETKLNVLEANISESHIHMIEFLYNCNKNITIILSLSIYK